MSEIWARLEWPSFFSTWWPAPADPAIPHQLHKRLTAVDTTHLIIGAVLGGTALILTSIFLLLCPARRRGSRSNPVSKRAQHRLSTPSPSPMMMGGGVGHHTVRPVTPSPPRLGTGAPSSARWVHALGTISMGGWDPEEHRGAADSTPPPGGDGGPEDGADRSSGSGRAVRRPQQPAPSISGAFAAEMSSLLESISLRSSYSSLRSGGGLGAPPRRVQRRAPAMLEGATSPAGASGAEEEGSGGSGRAVAV